MASRICGRKDEQVWFWLKGKNLEFINVSGISNKLEVTTKDARIINLASKYTFPLPQQGASWDHLSAVHYLVCIIQQLCSCSVGVRELLTAAAAANFYVSSLSPCSRKKMKKENLLMCKYYLSN